MATPPKVPPFFSTAFFFKVNVVEINGTYEGSFQEVTGITAKVGILPVKEGDENRFEHRLPIPVKYDNLILKRGMVLSSDLINWARKAIEQFDFTTTTVIVNLLDETSAPIASWSFKNAYPVALKISDLKAQDNAIVIETVELSYSYFIRVF